jgi:hypothetical protein
MEGKPNSPDFSREVPINEATIRPADLLSLPPTGSGETLSHRPESGTGLAEAAVSQPSPAPSGAEPAETAATLSVESSTFTDEDINNLDLELTSQEKRINGMFDQRAA